MDTTIAFMWCHAWHGCLRQADKHCVTGLWLRDNKREGVRVLRCSLKENSVCVGRGHVLLGTACQVNQGLWICAVLHAAVPGPLLENNKTLTYALPINIHFIKMSVLFLLWFVWEGLYLCCSKINTMWKLLMHDGSMLHKMICVKFQ